MSEIDEKIEELRKTLTKSFQIMTDSRCEPEVRDAAKKRWVATLDLLDFHKGVEVDNCNSRRRSMQLTPQVVFTGRASQSLVWVPLKGHPNENRRWKTW